MKKRKQAKQIYLSLLSSEKGRKNWGRQMKWPKIVWGRQEARLNTFEQKKAIRLSHYGNRILKGRLLRCKNRRRREEIVTNSQSKVGLRHQTPQMPETKAKGVSFIDGSPWLFPSYPLPRVLVYFKNLRVGLQEIKTVIDKETVKRKEESY